LLDVEHLDDPGDALFHDLDAFSDRVVFQTREWLRFVASTQRATPVICALNSGSTTVGYFTGLTVRRYGVPILGSPMRGWSTWYMGFNLHDGVPRDEAVRALLPFALGALGCWHVELGDRHLDPAAAARLEVGHDLQRRAEIDLRPSEDEILGSMSSACRRAIRKAEKSGVTIEEADDIAFADDYYSHLLDVYAKQSRVPPYSIGHVRALLHHLVPSGHLLLLRARDAQGRCIATGIFPGLNRTAYFWGGASLREHQIVRPNEALMWHALRYWKARGIEACDLGGIGGFEYKRKYGPREVEVPLLHASKYRSMWTMRNLALRAMRERERLLALTRRGRAG
jgi:hypothetical protein